MFETIVALATPPGRSALAVIRLSGRDCLHIVSEIFDHDLAKIRERKIVHGYLYDGGKKIDEVVLLVYPKGRSFTGEDAVEIMTHGSMVIAQEIITLLLTHGARLATNGEFSNRAFLNGRIDLVQAEAINDLINAETIEAKDLSLISLTGATSALFHPIREELAALIANIEVNIDYPEVEDIEVVTAERVIATCDRLLKDIDELIITGERNRLCKSGVDVAIVGKPNVGKSSLLNALLNEEKAIVTDVAGTTRDVVEGTYDLHGVQLRLFDTAGYRETDGKIERLGVEKTLKTIQKADLVIHVHDESGLDERLTDALKTKKVIVIQNKTDVLGARPGEIAVSAKEHTLEPLLTAISRALKLDEIKVVPSFINVRQLALLKRMTLDLKEARKDAKEGKTVDLLALSVSRAYQSALELLGEGKRTTDLTEEIFSHFCVGK